jgi:hypothetical protein
MDWQAWRYLREEEKDRPEKEKTVSRGLAKIEERYSQ